MIKTVENPFWSHRFRTRHQLQQQSNLRIYSFLCFFIFIMANQFDDQVNPRYWPYDVILRHCTRIQGHQDKSRKLKWYFRVSHEISANLSNIIWEFHKNKIVKMVIASPRPIIIAASATLIISQIITEWNAFQNRPIRTQLFNDPIISLTCAKIRLKLYFWEKLWNEHSRIHAKAQSVSI